VSQKSFIMIILGFSQQLLYQIGQSFFKKILLK